MSDDEILEPTPTFHDYIDRLLGLTSRLMKESVGTPFYPNIDEITQEMDQILIEMRHGDWGELIG